MYSSINFQSKKQLKDAVTAWNEYRANKDAWELARVSETLTIGGVLGVRKEPKAVRVFQPGPFGGNAPSNGRVALEGPHYPQPHKWYAECELKDGVVVKVR